MLTPPIRLALLPADVHQHEHIAEIVQDLVGKHLFSTICVPDEAILVINGLTLPAWRMAVSDLLRVHPGDLLLQGFGPTNDEHLDWLRSIGAIPWQVSSAGVTLSLGPTSSPSHVANTLSVNDALRRTRALFRYFSAGAAPNSVDYRPIPQAALSGLFSRI